MGRGAFTHFWPPSALSISAFCSGVFVYFSETPKISPVGSWPATFLSGLTDADLDRVVDDEWDPPVTLGVRLISVIDDDAQHAGQAAYIRGLLP